MAQLGDGVTRTYDVASAMVSSVLQLAAGQTPPTMAYGPDGIRPGRLAITDGNGAVHVVTFGLRGMDLEEWPAQRPAAALAFLTESKVAVVDGGCVVRLVAIPSGREEAV